LDSAYPFAFWPRHLIEGVAGDFGALTEAVLSFGGIELPFERKTGEHFWGLVTGTELKDRRGQPAGFLMSVADISNQKRAQNAMRKLSSRLVDRQESERKFVAQELHDGISGKLAAVKYSIEKIISEIRPDKDPLKASLGDVLSIVHDAIDETQRIYRNLHPAILDDLGLKAALKSLCREFMEVYDTTVVESRFEVPQDRIQGPLKILIYRIAQEALNNVAKHSQADRVEISLRLVENKVDLVIRDNGKGFDRDKAQAVDIQDRGLGLENIKERTIIFGGTLEIQSAPGKGTAIRVSWPL
jgi:signal transduction histidine kinase